MKLLELSLGPVQGFVARSRRTRDLWASSYLLSYLSAQAIAGAEEAGASLIRPAVSDDPMLAWVRFLRDGHERPAGDPPVIGSLPNRFLFEIHHDPVAIAEGATRAIRGGWSRIFQVVWDRFVCAASSAGHGTEAIWERQVEGFWEILWVAGEDEQQRGLGNLLERRKQWRTHRPPDEPGDKCSLMPDFQELSGYVRARERDEQERFWKRMRQRLGALDLRENERLCAIALVKRLFPKIARKALGWELDVSHWPSTTYVAALPWIRRVVETCPEEASAYAEALLQAASHDVVAEKSPPFRGLAAAHAGDFPRLDGSYLHPVSLRSERVTPLADEEAERVRGDLLNRLKEMGETKDHEGQPLRAPSVFHAVLLADGDRLGHQVRTLGPETVSAALARFTETVPGQVEQHDGVLVYAGGDDVLALLPLDRALECARAVEEAYRTAFGNGRATLSTSLVLAHIRAPLGRVLQYAHHLLDDVAKDENGRDSLAVAVWKRGGLHCRWVTTWRRRSGGGPGDAVQRLQKLVEALRTEEKEPGISASLIHRLHETLSLLCGWPAWKPGTWKPLPDGLDVVPYLEAEVHRSLALDESVAGEETNSRGDELARLLADLLSRSRATGAASQGQAGREVGLDAWLLAHFLAGGGREEAHG